MAKFFATNTCIHVKLDDVVYDYLKKMNASITISSGFDKYTTFTVYLNKKTKSLASFLFNRPGSARICRIDTSKKSNNKYTYYDFTKSNFKNVKFNSIWYKDKSLDTEYDTADNNVGDYQLNMRKAFNDLDQNTQDEVDGVIELISDIKIDGKYQPLLTSNIIFSRFKDVEYNRKNSITTLTESIAKKQNELNVEIARLTLLKRA